jgi:polyhydroxyalkanoate synthesis regulator phasin
MSSAKAVGAGIAGGAIAAALLDLLTAKGILTQDESKSVLEDAMYRAAMHTGTAEGLAAANFIGDLLGVTKT